MDGWVDHSNVGKITTYSTETISGAKTENPKFKKNSVAELRSIVSHFYLDTRSSLMKKHKWCCFVGIDSPRC